MLWSGFTVYLIGILACSKPTLIGTDLLSDNVSEVGFTDTLTIRWKTVEADSVRAYSPLVADRVANLLVGNLNDPVFGATHSEFYAQLRLIGSADVILGTVIDSVVLTLRYDTIGLYGDYSKPVTIEVHEMTELAAPDQEYYSNVVFPTAEMPLAIKPDFVPAPFDSVFLNGPADTIGFLPHLRIPLDADFANRLLALDTATLTSNDSFQNWFNGIRVRMTNAEDAMLGFDLNTALSGISVYYRNAGEATNVLRFAFDAFQMPRFVHDHSAGIVGPYIDNAELGDSLGFIQSMSGLNLEISVEGLDDLGDILINSAMLEMYVVELPGDDLVLYPVTRQLIPRQLDDAGALVNSRDAARAINVIGNILAIGGNYTSLESNPEVAGKYSMILTAQLQDIQNKRIDHKIFLSSFLKANFPDRTVILGPGHSKYPARIKVTYTKVR